MTCECSDCQHVAPNRYPAPTTEQVTPTEVTLLRLAQLARAQTDATVKPGDHYDSILCGNVALVMMRNLFHTHDDLYVRIREWARENPQ